MTDFLIFEKWDDSIIYVFNRFVLCNTMQYAKTY